MQFRLNCLSGSAAGKSFEFNQSVVTVGREEGCHLKLDAPVENRISGRHCEIFEQDGKAYVRDLDSLNGTIVDEVRITAPTVLRAGARLQLGSKGSAFVFEPLAARNYGTVANTLGGRNAETGNIQPVKAGVGLQTMERKIEEAVSEAREDARWAQSHERKRGALIAVSVLLAALLAVAVGWHFTHKDINTVAQRQASSESEMKEHMAGLMKRYDGIATRVEKSEFDVQKQLADLGQEMSEKGRNLAALEKKLSDSAAASTDERERLTREIARARSEVTALGSTVEKYQEGNKELLSKAIAPFKAVLEAAKDSVYSVFIRNDKNQYSEIGTAFAVNSTKGLLGTNGHISKPVAEMLDAGKTIVVRCNCNPRFTYRVKRAFTHPDYIDGVNGAVQRQSPDVGILELDLVVDGQLLTMPGYLRPGLPEELDKLGTGDVVAMLGFPGTYHTAYERPDGATNVAKMTSGVLSSTLSFGGMPVKGRDFDMIEHTCASVPGSSGSPIFSTNGRVVSVLNSGIFERLSNGVHIQSGAVNYGISIRFLKQLLDRHYEANVWN